MKQYTYFLLWAVATLSLYNPVSIYAHTTAQFKQAEKEAVCKRWEDHINDLTDILNNNYTQNKLIYFGYNGDCIALINGKNQTITTYLQGNLQYPVTYSYIQLLELLEAYKQKEYMFLQALKNPTPEPIEANWAII